MYFRTNLVGPLGQGSQPPRHQVARPLPEIGRGSAYAARFPLMGLARRAFEQPLELCHPRSPYRASLAAFWRGAIRRFEPLHPAAATAIITIRRREPPETLAGCG